MKKLSIVTTYFMLLFYLGSCKEDLGISQPLVNDGVAPGTVSGISVTNRPGTAKIVYHIPGDNDLSYVKAEYEIRPGVFREVKSSKTNDSLIVDGFSQAKEYQVKLYAVDMGENKSAPVIVTVKPTLPPVVTVLNSLNLMSDFGGVSVVTNNPTSAEVAIVMVEKIANGPDKTLTTFYTKSKKEVFNIRGYKPVPVIFGVYLRDKFGNVSEMMYKEVTPIEEVRLDRFLFSAPLFPNDMKSFDPGSWGVEKIWDNSTWSGFHSLYDDPTILFPQWISINLGVKAQLSRFKLFQRTADESFIFSHFNIKTFEVWGSNNPSPDGNWDNWVFMGRFESIKPSGLPVGQNTNEDRAKANEGEDYTMPIGSPAVRYIRIKALSNWSGSGFLQLMEAQFWGNLQ